MPNQVSKELFGKKLRELREKHSYSLRQVSNQSKTQDNPPISPSYWSLIERGERNIPKPDTLKRMAHGLRIPATEILKIAGYSEIDDVISNSKPVDLKNDKDPLITYGGKPISDDYMEIFRKILKDYDDDKSGKK